MTSQNKKNRIKPLIVTIVIMLVWFILSRMNIFSAFVFPGPGKVFGTFLAMLKSGELIKNIGVSVLRIVTGFSISFMLAFCLAILAVLHPKAEEWLQPVLSFLRQIPPMSMIPLLILWFGIGEAPKIIVIVLTAFFPIFMNTEAGLKECDNKLLEVGQVLKMTKQDIFFKIQLPAAVPSILTGIKIGLGYSFRAIIGAEMIAAASGLGYLILDSQAMSRTDKVIIGIITIGLIGLIADALLEKLIKKYNVYGRNANE